MPSNPKQKATVIRKIDNGIWKIYPAPLFPKCGTPTVITAETLKQMSCSELCEAIIAEFYREPGGTHTPNCMALYKALGETLRYSSY